MAKVYRPHSLAFHGNSFGHLLFMYDEEGEDIAPGLDLDKLHEKYDIEIILTKKNRKK